MIKSKFFCDYTNMIQEASVKVDEKEVAEVCDILRNAYLNNIPVYAIGNGGSAAISQHFSCDHSKGVCHDTMLKGNVISLATNVSLMTAIANDYNYDEVFSKQIEYVNSKFVSSILIAISSSGNSNNILEGLKTARRLGWATIAFVGFDGGKVYSEKLADNIILVPSNNYGVVEDIHQMLMHSISQEIRKEHCSNPSMKL